MKINLVIAHALEVKCLIQQFAMQQRNESPLIYENAQGMRLIVCGEGAQCAVDGVNVLHAHNDGETRAWLNLGIAGHQSRALGQCFVANKIVNRASREVAYPAPMNHGQAVGELHTVVEPELSYPDDVGYDMEAYPFFEAATGNSTLELVQVFKIISDNKAHDARKISKADIIESFRQNREAIAATLECLEQSRALYEQSQFVPKDFQVIESSVHLTATRRAQVYRLCQRLTALGLETQLRSITDSAAAKNIDGKKLVDELSQVLAKHEAAI